MPFPPSPSVLSQIIPVLSDTIGKSAANVPPQGKILARTIPVAQQVGKHSFYLAETAQLAPNKLKYFYPSSRVYG